jgi:hypothetical protein
MGLRGTTANRGPGLAALLCGLLGFIAESPAQSVDATLVDTWSGTYDCATVRDAPFTLEVTSQAAGRLAGVFRFEIPGAPGRTGAYKVVGRIGAGGRLTIVPQEWIERPEGYRALGLTGVLRENGRRIEGSVSDCGFGSGFTASRGVAGGGAAAGGSPADAGLATPDPITGGPVQGEWAGTITCGANRRNPETLGVRATMVQDGAGVAALFRIEVSAPRGLKAGAATEQSVVAHGQVDGEVLALSDGVLIDGRGPTRFRGMEGSIASGGASLTGVPGMNGCQAIALQKAGPAVIPSLPADLAGVWHGSHGRTDITASVMAASVPPFLELRAQHPDDQPADARDRFRLSLVPLRVHQGRTILVPVRVRDATGVFDRARQQVTRHSLSLARALVLAGGAADTLEMRDVSRDQDIARIFGPAGSTPAQPGRRDVTLTRAGAALVGTLSAGATAPLALPGSVGGKLAAAGSREAQCAALRDWLQPHRAGVDLNRLSVDAGSRAILDAFADPSFVPVFGLSFALLAPEERRSIRELLYTRCGGAMGMRDLRDLVVVQPFQGEPSFIRTTTLLTNRAEAVAWFASAGARMADLPDTQASLDDLARLDRDAAKRYGDVSPADERAFRSLLRERAVAVEGGILIREVEVLALGPDTTDTLFALARLMDRTARSQASETAKQEIAKSAGTKAGTISGPIYAEAARRAKALPHSLAGLAGLRVIQLELAPVIKVMGDHFVIDGDGQLLPISDRERAFLGDPAILRAIRDELMAVQPAGDPLESVRAALQRYVGLQAFEGASAIPALRRAVADATVAAEIRSIDLRDSAGSPTPGEPSAQVIVALVLERLSGANERIQSTERQCLTGGYREDVLLAVECLQILALTGGRGGMRVRLTAFTKLGCRPLSAPNQFSCLFSVAHTSNSPMLTGRMGELFATPGVQDGLFIHGADGSWTMVYGDL